MAREIDGVDAIEAGDQIRVEYDDNNVEGRVADVGTHGENRVVVDGDDDAGYILWAPEYSYESWRLQRGDTFRGGDREEVTGDADVVEVLDDD